MTFFTENGPGKIVDTDKWFPVGESDRKMFEAGWKYRLVLNRSGQFSAACNWCKENLEPDTYSWASWKFYFKTEESAAWFKLRWL
jgi:hypothetical protein